MQVQARVGAGDSRASTDQEQDSVLVLEKRELHERIVLPFLTHWRADRERGEAKRVAEEERSVESGQERAKTKKTVTE